MLIQAVIISIAFGTRKTVTDFERFSHFFSVPDGFAVSLLQYVAKNFLCLGSFGSCGRSSFGIFFSVTALRSFLVVMCSAGIWFHYTLVVRQRGAKPGYVLPVSRAQEAIIHIL